MDTLIDQNIAQAYAQMTKINFAKKCNYAGAAVSLLTIPALMLPLNRYSMFLPVYLGSYLFGKVANHFETKIDTQTSSVRSLQDRVISMMDHKHMMDYKASENMFRQPGDPLLLNPREQLYLSRNRVMKRELRYEETKTKRSEQHLKNMIDLFGGMVDDTGRPPSLPNTMP